MTLSDDLSEIASVYQEIMEENKEREDTEWNSLDYDSQLNMFCAVIRRLHEAELVEKRSYRGVLYDAFEFEPDAYGRAQDAGFLDIHNALYTKDDITDILLEFTKHFNVNVLDEDVVDYVRRKHI